MFSVPILKIQKRRPKSVWVKDNSCQEFHKSSQQDEKYISGMNVRILLKIYRISSW